MDSIASSTQKKVPRREYGTKLSNRNLPATIPIVGLGCSSFSSFFWNSNEAALNIDRNNKSNNSNNSNTDCSNDLSLTLQDMSKDQPCVQQWIETIRYAVLECGIDLLDTAPWYGHGTSEVVIGWAIEAHQELRKYRERMTINTKVGRYEADPLRQFDFSYDTTLKSIQRSIHRMQCTYIDVLQLHDPEFAPSLSILMKETLPALQYARKMGWCRALGMTGYPLEVQHQILQESMHIFGENIWDQALTYGHFNLHNTRLIHQRLHPDVSFASYCEYQKIGLVAAAPLSMGLLKPPKDEKTIDFPEWHPASDNLKKACKEASIYSKSQGVNIASLAILFALSERRIASTIIGCKNVEEVQHAANLANRFHQDDENNNDLYLDDERKTLDFLLDDTSGPFSEVKKGGEHFWDGVQEVRAFWKTVPSVQTEQWQQEVAPVHSENI